MVGDEITRLLSKLKLKLSPPAKASTPTLKSCPPRIVFPENVQFAHVRRLLPLQSMKRFSDTSTLAVTSTPANKLLNVALMMVLLMNKRVSLRVAAKYCSTESCKLVKVLESITRSI
jgi:hypothetical protein